jgi:Ca2+-binding RTX toxin-like protein
MPLTPEVWEDQTTVNAGPGQGAVSTTQLTNGRILVAWQEIVVSGGIPPIVTGMIRGQILDYDGTLIGGELTLNTLETTGIQSTPSVTALENGNFAVTYTSAEGTGDLDLIYEVFNASGAFVRSDRVFDDLTSNTFDIRNSVISAGDANNAIMAYVIDGDDGGEDVAFRIVNTTTGSNGTEDIAFVGASGAGEDIGGIAVTTLTNGSYVLVYSNINVGNDSLLFRTVTASGSPSGQFTIADDFENITDPDVTALTGGRFVVSYTVDGSGGTNTGIRFRVYEANGTPVTNILSPLTTATGNQVNSRVTGLADGGFVITWEDNEIDDIRGQRFNANGATVGIEFAIDIAGTQTQGDVQATEDGRFFSTWVEGGEVRIEFYDTRDIPNTTPAYNIGLVVGTIGDDNVNGSSNVSYDLWDGNDTLSFTAGEPSFLRIYEGGDGTDMLRFVGSGTLDFRLSVIRNFEALDYLSTAVSPTDRIVQLNASQFGTGLISTTAAITGFGAAGSASSILEIYSISNSDFSNLVFSNWTDKDEVRLFGTSGANTINGTDVYDIIEGLAGADTLAGGAGNDMLSYASSNAGVTVDLGTGAASGGHAAGDVFSSFLDLRGSAHADVLTGTSGNNLIEGLAGDDVISGGSGTDTLEGGSGNDTISVGSGSNDSAYGGADNDLVIMGDSSIDGDQFFGGGGLGDIFDVSGFNWGTAVTIDLESGTWSFSSGSETVAEFEHVRGATQINTIVETIIGNSANNQLVGNGGNDSVAGRDGQDVLFGGTGNDTLRGDNDNDTLFGGDDDDVLVGGIGDDRSEGGIGNDTYQYDFATGGLDTIFEIGGTDTLNATDSSIATLEFRRSGTSLVIEKPGTTGKVTIEDHFGAAGSRVEFLQTLGAFHSIKVDNVGTASSEIFVDTSGANTINGLGGNDIIFAAAGNDTLMGGAGNDRVFGGQGSDLYNFSYGAGNEDFISERGGNGTDTLNILDRAAEDLEFRRSGSLLVIEETATTSRVVIDDHFSGIPTERIEILTATDGLRFLKNTNIGTATSDIIVGALADDVINGAGGDDLIFGGGGGDTLTGGAGDDLLKGGTGNDRYVFSFATSDEDVISEVNGGGTDTLAITDADIAELGIRRSGNILVIENPDVSDRIVIKDHFSGVATNRIELVESAGVTRFFKTNLVGTATSDIIVGASGAETINGGGGDDIIVGGGSNDALTGGTGADVFLFAQVSDSTAAAAGRDTIIDFSQAEGDRIAVTALDANTGLAGDNDFVFLGLGATTGAGTLAFSFAGGNTLVQADIDGGGADFAVLLAGQINLTAGDFIL